MFSLMAWRGKKITTNTKLTKRPIKIGIGCWLNCYFKHQYETHVFRP